MAYFCGTKCLKLAKIAVNQRHRSAIERFTRATFSFHEIGRDLLVRLTIFGNNNFGSGEV